MITYADAVSNKTKNIKNTQYVYQYVIYCVHMPGDANSSPPTFHPSASFHLIQQSGLQGLQMSSGSSG